MTKDRLCAAASAPILIRVNNKMEMGIVKAAFWQRAAQSLPKSVRSRYAARLERAERAERVDLLIAALADALRRLLASREPRLHS